MSKDRIITAEQLDKAAEKTEKALDISAPNKPKRIPDFPEDITSLSSEGVGNLLSAFDSEIAFIRYRLAQVEVKLNYGMNVVDVYKKQVYLAMRATYSSSDAGAWAEMDSKVLDANIILNQLRMEITLLQARLDMYTKYSSSVSREISRRKNDHPGQASNMESSKPQLERIEKIAGRELKPKAKRKEND